MVKPEARYADVVGLLDYSTVPRRNQSLSSVLHVCR